MCVLHDAWIHIQSLSQVLLCKTASLKTFSTFNLTHQYQSVRSQRRLQDSPSVVLTPLLQIKIALRISSDIDCCLFCFPLRAEVQPQRSEMGTASAFSLSPPPFIFLGSNTGNGLATPTRMELKLNWILDHRVDWSKHYFARGCSGKLKCSVSSVCVWCTFCTWWNN